MTFKLGLTGSIGMGKSTTAQMFVKEGCVLWDADAAVHRLYSNGGAAVEPIGEQFPEVIDNGAVSRERLKALIAADPKTLKLIEKIVHPLVAKDRQNFLKTTSEDIVVLDIPLLFESGSDAQMDAIVCVTVSPNIQQKRVLERPNMTAEQFKTILIKQMPDAEKRKRSDYVIETETLEGAKKQVQTVIRDIREKLNSA